MHIHSLVHLYTAYVLNLCIYSGSVLSLLSGLSPLHLAVLLGHKDIARMLLDAGADINAMVSPCAALSQH